MVDSLTVEGDTLIIGDPDAGTPQRFTGTFEIVVDGENTVIFMDFQYTYGFTATRTDAEIVNYITTVDATLNGQDVFGTEFVHGTTPVTSDAAEVQAAFQQATAALTAAAAPDGVVITGPTLASTTRIETNRITNALGTATVVYFDVVNAYELVGTRQPETVTARIDVKPGSSRNPINVDDRGVIPVVLFTENGFDVRQVDLSTLRFAGAAPAHWSFADVDWDGDLDLVLHFRTQQTTLGDQYEDGARQLQVALTGQTHAGESFEAFDSVELLANHGKKCNPPPPKKPSHVRSCGRN